VKRLCEWLGVSTSGFYAWVKREASKHYHEDQALLVQITEIFWRSEGRYGSPRVHQALLSQGISVGRKRVERLMRESGLRARVVRVTRRLPGLKRFKARGENLRLEMEAPTAINQVWVGDVTYLKLNGKWQYLATVMDLYSRRIIGWSLSKSRTMELTCAAMTYALKKRGHPTDVIFHTDRGIEYTGADFQRLLKHHSFKHSVNRPKHCTDNAHMESFYHSLKAELIRGTVFKTVKAMRQALARYINRFYNTVRLHSGLDYLSPIQYEQRAA
jgi:transposase InsO family protein